MAINKHVAVGTLLYGHCSGYFGRKSYSDKRIEAIGADWVVVRERDGIPDFATFSDSEDMMKLLLEWSNEKSMEM